MAYSVVTAASSEPITLNEAKNFLRVDGSDDEELVDEEDLVSDEDDEE